MPRYKIVKLITAKNIGQALRQEKTAEVDEISKVEKEDDGSANTHAIGFHIPPDQLDTESYDPSP